ncbi:hypothetical protein BLNAU_19129 [Blattamonas nauphoetae]|uniref:AIG1-type G domain-containing protein n=1 Tax=Blattamonas nauphoetae TaxID=2049346 RepID=A0ABQ9X2W0_9EUKA|nr:hypothetical protein BLNAU_19129 [Blattamonas nauphoetae]
MFLSSSGPQKIKLTAFGPTGDGKSQFLSMLCGRPAFPVGHRGCSQTQMSHALEHQINKQHFWLIDQPGVSSLGYMEQGHLDRIRNSLEREGSINAICLCIRASRNRVDASFQTSLRHLRNMFAKPEIYPHLCLIITHTDSQQKKTQFLNNMLPELNALIDQLFENQRRDHGDLPIFFFDSAINPDRATKAEKERFLAHVATLSAISTSDINRFDARYKLVTEEIIEETSPGGQRRHMITIVRKGTQDTSEEGEWMPVTIHQKKKQLKQECWEEDEFGNPIISYRQLGPVGEPWETVDDSGIRIFKKVFKTRRTFLGGVQERHKNFDRKGKCIETSDWIMIVENKFKISSLVEPLIKLAPVVYRYFARSGQGGASTTPAIGQI